MKLPLEKSKQSQHTRTSSTGKVFIAGKGMVKQRPLTNQEMKKYQNLINDKDYEGAKKLLAQFQREEEDKLEGAARYVSMYKDDLRERKTTTNVTKWKKGLSDDVVFTEEFIDYTENREHPFGYIGSSNRTPERDKILEDLLRDQGLDGGGIAIWMTSGDGRHLMDDVDKNTTSAQFKKRAKEYTHGAFEDVLLWSHPDADGGHDTKVKIGQKVYDYYKEKVMKNEGLRNDFIGQVEKFLQNEENNSIKDESKELLNSQIAMVEQLHWGDKEIRIALKNGGAIIYPEGYRIKDYDKHSIMRTIQYDKDKEYEGKPSGWGTAIRYLHLKEEK